LSIVRGRWAPRVVLGASGLCVALLAYAGSQLMLPASPVQPVGKTPMPTLAGSSSIWEASAQASALPAATRAGPAPKMPSSEKQVFGRLLQHQSVRQPERQRAVSYPPTG